MKKTSIIRMALPFMLATLFGSCVVYHPHNVDIPLLHQKGELEVDANCSMSFLRLDGSAFNATVSYAPLNHVGVQVAASTSNKDSYFLQAAAGGFLPMGDNAVLEGYAGYGFGTSLHMTTMSLDDSYHEVRGHYNLYFGQVNVGSVDLLGGILDFGIGFKGGLMVPNFERNLVKADGQTVFEEKHTDSHVLLQPQFVIRAGWQIVKLSFNLGYAYLTDWPETDNYYNYEHLSVGLGLHFDF